MLGETLFVPLSLLPHSDADRNEGEAAMREAETVRNPAQTTSGVFLTGRFRPHAKSGRAPFSP